MKLIKILTLMIVLASVLALGASGLGVYFNTPPNPPAAGEEGTGEYFRISRGETAGEIARSLEDRGLIRSALAFTLFSRLKGSGRAMKAGYYLIPPGAALVEIHDLLLKGSTLLYRVTIPEGWTAGQIARRLSEEGICGEEEFLEALRDPASLREWGIEGGFAEGFLYPDTYYFPPEFPPGRAAGVMIGGFFEALGRILQGEALPQGGPLYEKVILASIVEREYRIPGEAALMAGVFYNRLREGIPLGSCATVAYIITDIQGKPHPERILYSDLEIRDPYNTYIFRGLPPAPISNPGEVSLRAAFFPEESDYYYFLLKDPQAGQHVFTRTLSEHDRAYNLYIKTSG
ncbi:MAG: endolytic transglycosylase MltG [Spirochaetales bacterium]|jgi:UPF0755 protein|nr:endolytic transglycosylase MltG [Spirochaetales bacterium]